MKYTFILATFTLCLICGSIANAQSSRISEQDITALVQKHKQAFASCNPQTMRQYLEENFTPSFVYHERTGRDDKGTTYSKAQLISFADEVYTALTSEPSIPKSVCSSNISLIKKNIKSDHAIAQTVETMFGEKKVCNNKIVKSKSGKAQIAKTFCQYIGNTGQ